MRSVFSTTPVADDPDSSERDAVRPPDAPPPVATEAADTAPPRPRIDLDVRAFQTYLRWIDKNVAEARVRLVLESGRDGKIDPERTGKLRELAQVGNVLRASADGSPIDASVATQGTNLFVIGRELLVPAGLPAPLFAPPPQVIEKPALPSLPPSAESDNPFRRGAEPGRRSVLPSRPARRAVAPEDPTARLRRPTRPEGATTAEAGATQPPTTPARPPQGATCPSCRRDDRVKSVEAARSAALARAAESALAGAGAGATVDAPAAAGVGSAELAKRLAAPSPPAYESPWGRWSVSTVSVALGIGAALLDWAATGASERWKAVGPGDDGRALVLVANLVLLAAAALVVWRSSESRARRSHFERELTAHRRARSAWEQTRYCHRCDVVFRPGQARFARSDALHAMIELT